MAPVAFGSTTRPSTANISSISGGISADAGETAKQRPASAAVAKRRGAGCDITFPPMVHFLHRVFDREILGRDRERPRRSGGFSHSDLDSSTLAHVAVAVPVG